VHETTTFLLVTLPNIHRLQKNTYIFSNKSFLIWLLTTQQYIKYVATLPCNLSLIACFLTLMFYKVTWQHMQGVVRFLITSLLQIYSEIFPWVNFMNRFRFDRIMVMSLWPHIWPILYSPLYTRAFQFGQKKFRFDSIQFSLPNRFFRFYSIQQSDKFAACTLIFK